MTTLRGISYTSLDTLSRAHVLRKVRLLAKILVTGGAGFVGSCLAMGLRRYKPELHVVALENRPGDIPLYITGH